MASLLLDAQQSQSHTLLHSQSKRPTTIARHPSTSSQLSQSPSDLSSSQRQGINKTPKHVVGHGRLSNNRNSSSGKNLNKLIKLASTHDGTPSSSSKHHPRRKSGDSNGSPTNSPRLTVKRNASTFVIPRTTSHSALKKNHSSGHLSRHGSSKNIMKSARQPTLLTKRTVSQKSDQAEQSPPDSPAVHPTVRFDLGEDDAGPDGENEAQPDVDEWTEESASASPHTTRSSTPARQSSVIAHTSMAASAAESEGQQHSAGESHRSARSPCSPRSHGPFDRTVREINGSSSFLPSRPLDADVITSRLLQRAAPHQNGLQVSTISATVTPESLSSKSVGHSQGSTLADGTPGPDLVSRFLNNGSSGSTPRDGSFERSTERTLHEQSDLDVRRRNRSTPNFLKDSPRPPSQRSGTSSPSEVLPLSRTQQKLFLQRASSNIDPQKHIPAVLPRSGASQLIGHGVSFSSTEGALPAQIQALFNQTAKEYQVVRRYRSPVADSIIRLGEIEGAPRPRYVPNKAKGKSSYVNGGDGKYGLSQSYKGKDEQSLRSEGRAENQGQGSSERRSNHGNRSRVSFDLPERLQPQGDADREQDEVPRSESGRVRDEASEICRRLWEIGEVAESG